MKQQLRVGVIGCGAIGREHLRRLTDVVPETIVTGVADYFLPAAQSAAEMFHCTAFQTGEDLIVSPDVDAVVVTSADPSHAAYVLEAIRHNKFVFCEKPLAQTAEECQQIIAAEQAAGKKLVQVGFMRRYDRGYMAMKHAISSNEIGAPLMIHAAHRNMSQAPGFETDYAVTRVAIHEIDICRWLLDDEYATAQVLGVRQSSRTSGEWLNPQIMMLTTRSGQRIDVEVQTDGAYAYDIQCHVVGEDGIVSLPDPTSVTKRAAAAIHTPLMTDWKDRFIEAYDIEFQEWAKSLLNGAPTGPSAWDGYVACVTGDALIRSRQTGKPEDIVLPEKPEMYQ